MRVPRDRRSSCGHDGSAQTEPQLGAVAAVLIRRLLAEQIHGWRRSRTRHRASLDNLTRWPHLGGKRQIPA